MAGARPKSRTWNVGSGDPWTEWTDKGGTTWRVSVGWDDVDGTLTPIGMTMESMERGNGRGVLCRAVVTTDLPIGTLIEESRRAFVAFIDSLARYGSELHQEAQKSIELNPKRGPGRPRKYEDQHYRQIADFYTRQVEHFQSLSPAKDVAEAFDLPVEIARRHLRKARKLGYLQKGKRM